MRRFRISIIDLSGLVRRPTQAAGRVLSRAARALFGTLSEGASGPPERSFSVSRDLFLRGLGIVLFIAFLSSLTQVLGLIGSRGILPLDESLKGVAANYGARRFFLLPTLFWFAARDGVLLLSCGLGVLASLLLMFGIAPFFGVLLSWMLYLSLVTGGAEFYNFQWDHLLLETAFAALFLAPLGRLRPVQRMDPPSAVRFLFLWLLFRVVFLSGAVKLISGNPAWGTLTALRYFFQSLPLPTPLSWCLHQLPDPVLSALCLGVLLVELLVPLAMFGGRRLRLSSFAILTVYQGLLMASANTNFFNLLVALLALFLVDDAAWMRLKSLRRFIHPDEPPRRPATGGRVRWPLLPYLLFVLVVSLMSVSADLGFKGPWPKPLLWLYRVNVPLLITSHYGYTLTAVDTRFAVTVEGSDDGKEWKEYGSRWAPGDVHRMPGFAAPRAPRLDVQLWLASFGDCERSPWLQQFMGRLLQNSKPVLGLLAKNPFPGASPRYVRTRLYDYRFTSLAEWWKTGDWWVRTDRGEMCPAISLPEDPNRGTEKKKVEGAKKPH